MFLEKTANPTKRSGWIEVICGSMFSGKTEELIRRLNRAKIAKHTIILQNTQNNANSHSRTGILIKKYTMCNIRRGKA